MITRLYIHNFRCLENFDLALSELPAVLLLGKNGAGKTTVGSALEILQKIARGTNRVDDLMEPKDIANRAIGKPIRFIIEASLRNRNYSYTIAFEFPSGFRELRVLEEKLSVDGGTIFSRELAQVKLARNGLTIEASFRIDWHLVALPIVQEYSIDDPLSIFKTWLKNFLILRPVPRLARGDSESNQRDISGPDIDVSNIGAWFTSLVNAFPASYARISDYLTAIMPDFQEIKNEPFEAGSRRLIFSFDRADQRIELPLEDLSDGEKCFVIYALVIATNTPMNSVLCFWDEPDNFLSPSEVGHSIIALRRAFQRHGQLIVTSHNPEAIRRFSENNTLLLTRNSHLEPTVVTKLGYFKEKSKFEGEFIDALIRGDIDP